MSITEITARAERMAEVHRKGLITDGELAIELGGLLGLDLSCQLGECACQEGI